MIPASFQYFAPKTIAEAVKLLGKYRDQAKILSGGHSLIPVMKLRLAQPKIVIDVGRLKDLAGIKEEKGTLMIGAGTTHYAIESSELLKKRCPMLAECAAQIGDIQVRNKGTIGGSCAHADPAADWPAAMLALEAAFTVRGPRGTRTVKARDFFVDMMTTALKENEILTRLTVPAARKGVGQAYLKVKQSASGFAICGVAVNLKMKNGVCESIALGITGIAAKPYRATAVEAMLRGQLLNEETIGAAAAHATDGIDPLSDIHASAEYRAHLARVYAARAIAAAAARSM